MIVDGRIVEMLTQVEADRDHGSGSGFEDDFVQPLLDRKLVEVCCWAEQLPLRHLRLTADGAIILAFARQLAAIDLTPLEGDPT